MPKRKSFVPVAGACAAHISAQAPPNLSFPLIFPLLSIAAFYWPTRAFEEAVWGDVDDERRKEEPRFDEYDEYNDEYDDVIALLREYGNKRGLRFARRYENDLKLILGPNWRSTIAGYRSQACRSYAIEVANAARERDAITLAGAFAFLRPSVRSSVSPSLT